MPELARTYRRILQLKHSPVAIRIITVRDEIPVLYKKPEKPLPSFCFGVTEAFKGKSFFLNSGDIQCPMGLAALGFKKNGLKKGKRKFPFQAGVFGNEEAAQNSFSIGIHLPAGQTKGVALSPLEKAVMGIDIVLFKVNCEQAKWLLTATHYQTGERSALSVGSGFHGVCEDVVAYPLVYNKVNMTVNGVGDRISSSTGKNGLLIGIPASEVPKIASNLTEIYHKPIFKSRHSPKGFSKTTSLRNGPRP